MPKIPAVNQRVYNKQELENRSVAVYRWTINSLDLKKEKSVNDCGKQQIKSKRYMKNAL